MLSIKERKQLDHIEGQLKGIARLLHEQNRLFTEHFDMLNHRVMKLEKKNKGGKR